MDSFIIPGVIWCVSRLINDMLWFLPLQDNVHQIYQTTFSHICKIDVLLIWNPRPWGLRDTPGRQAWSGWWLLWMLNLGIWKKLQLHYEKLAVIVTMLTNLIVSIRKYWCLSGPSLVLPNFSLWNCSSVV